jgi:hypothetical protein
VGKVGFGKDVSPNLVRALRRLKLVAKHDGELELTPDRGVRLFDAWHVYRDRDEAKTLLRAAYLELPVTQALMQGLHGRPALAVKGALNLIARHRLADRDDPKRFRALLQVLNDVSIIAYSKQQQTVRIVEPMPVAEAPNEEPSIRIIEPDLPFQNVRHLRETLRQCNNYIWWAEPHFTKKIFESLHDEADATKIRQIRLLTGPVQEGLNDYKRFKAEMDALGITIEWRFVETRDRDWHDRYIVTRGKAWNVPPTNTLYKGDYSEITITMVPPFEAWWAQGTPVP